MHIVSDGHECYGEKYKVEKKVRYCVWAVPGADKRIYMGVTAKTMRNGGSIQVSL